MSKFLLYYIIYEDRFDGVTLPRRKNKEIIIFKEIWNMRVYNFSAGPSMLPLEVLEEAQKEFIRLVDYGADAIRLTFQNGNGIELLSTLLRSFSWGDNYYTELVSL